MVKDDGTKEAVKMADGNGKYGIWDKQNNEFSRFFGGPYDSREAALEDDLLYESLWTQYVDGNGGNDEVPVQERKREAYGMSVEQLLDFFDYEVRQAEPPHTVFNVDEGVYVDADQDLVWVTPDGMYDHPASGATLTPDEFRDRRLEPLYGPGQE